MSSSAGTLPKSACGATQSRLRALPPGTYPARSASSAPSMSGTALLSMTAVTLLALASL